MQNTKLWSDLLLGLGVLALSVLLLLTPVNVGLLRVVVAFVALLFVPGYAASAALFPQSRELGLINRVALTLGLSIAAVPFTALLLNATPWGITPGSTAIGLLVLTALLSGIAVVRRLRAGMPGESGLFRSRASRQMLGAFAAVLLGIVAVGTLTAGLRAQSRYTEFYALGDTGALDRYPGPGPAGQMLTVRLGVVNHERTATDYTITSPACGEIVQVPTLTPGQAWDGVFQCRRVSGADLIFDLHRSGTSAPYRHLILRQPPASAE